MLTPSDASEDHPGVVCLRERLSPEEAVEMRRMRELTPTLSAVNRIDALDLAIPALRQLAPERYEGFAETVRLVLAAELKPGPGGLMLEKLLARHLHGHFHRKPAVAGHPNVFPGLIRSAATVLLAAVANLAGDTAAAKLSAFRTGADAYEEEGGVLDLPNFSSSWEEISRAMDSVAQADMALKNRLIRACAQSIGADGQIRDGEAELLRAITDGIEASLPWRNVLAV